MQDEPRRQETATLVVWCVRALVCVGLGFGRWDWVGLVGPVVAWPATKHFFLFYHFSEIAFALIKLDLCIK